MKINKKIIQEEVQKVRQRILNEEVSESDEDELDLGELEAKREFQNYSLLYGLHNRDKFIKLYLSGKYKWNSVGVDNDDDNKRLKILSKIKDQDWKILEKDNSDGITCYLLYKLK